MEGGGTRCEGRMRLGLICTSLLCFHVEALICRSRELRLREVLRKHVGKKVEVGRRSFHSLAPHSFYCFVTVREAECLWNSSEITKLKNRRREGPALWKA